MNPQVVKEGIYLDLPESKYFAIPAVHNSLLSKLNDKSPKHALHYAVHGSPTSKVQKIGRKLHMALLEPVRFKNEVIPYLSGDGRTKRVKQSKKFVKNAYPEASEYAKLEEIDKYRFQAEQARTGEIPERIFSSGESEVTMVAQDPETGLPLKCRWDYINFEIGVGFDYKTTRNAHPDSFHWDIWKYGYYRQVALYRYIASLLDVDLHTQLILAQEKKPPFVSVWYDLAETALKKGENDVRDLINQFNQCIRNEEFKGYVNENTGRNIIPTDLPEKAYRQNEPESYTTF